MRITKSAMDTLLEETGTRVGLLGRAATLPVFYPIAPQRAIPAVRIPAENNHLRGSSLCNYIRPRPCDQCSCAAPGPEKGPATRKIRPPPGRGPAAGPRL